MVFSDLTFLYCFLPLLFLLYYPFPSDTWRRGVLCVFSLLFYAWGEPVYVLLLLGIVLFNYFMGRAIGIHTDSGKRKRYLLAALIGDVGVLVLFKYVPFFLETCNSFLPFRIPIPAISLPIGISFFTFQAISYIADVYRGDVTAQKSLWRLLLYLSFFPQLIAGPIVRYKDIEEQLESREVFLEDVNDGLFRFALGLAKKVLIADVCDLAVTALYGLEEMTLLSRWAGALFFALQLYFDFSAYSDMAIGLGLMLGFEFGENFAYPLAANSVTDFWRKWHISLGSFFRDYVYIPLGGNRKKQLRNILIVWFLTGLWHGASWNFVLWGLYYAVLLILEKKFLLGCFAKLPKPVRFLVQHAYLLLITVFGFAIFYFDTDLFANLAPFFGIGTSGFTDIYTDAILMQYLYLLIVALIFAFPTLPILWDLTVNRTPYPVQRILMTVLILGLVGLSTVRLVGNTYSPFLYFRF